MRSNPAEDMSSDSEGDSDDQEDNDLCSSHDFLYKMSWEESVAFSFRQARELRDLKVCESDPNTAVCLFLFCENFFVLLCAAMYYSCT